jgi:16S rRNA (uracil1498-N3)-methyltransferase
MNLVLLEDGDLIGHGQAQLRGPRARHILDVHRAAVGDRLRVGVVGGLAGRAIVTALSSEEVVLAIELSEPPPPPLRIELLLALPRPKMLRRLLAAVASMGIKRVVLINSARVEKSYFESPLLAPAAIRQELLLGLSQACDTILPAVSIRQRFRPFVEDEADAFWPAPARRLVAHLRSERDLCDVPPAPVDGTTVLAVGPEGGWVPFEVELLEAHGFLRFAAGTRVLRVDTAVPFLIGQLALLSRTLARSGAPRTR